MISCVLLKTRADHHFFRLTIHVRPVDRETKKLKFDIQSFLVLNQPKNLQLVFIFDGINEMHITQRINYLEEFGLQRALNNDPDNRINIIMSVRHKYMEESRVINELFLKDDESSKIDEESCLILEIQSLTGS